MPAHLAVCALLATQPTPYYWSHCVPYETQIHTTPQYRNDTGSSVSGVVTAVPSGQAVAPVPGATSPTTTSSTSPSPQPAPTPTPPPVSRQPYSYVTYDTDIFSRDRKHQYDIQFRSDNGRRTVTNIGEIETNYLRERERITTVYHYVDASGVDHITLGPSRVVPLTGTFTRDRSSHYTATGGALPPADHPGRTVSVTRTGPTNNNLNAGAHAHAASRHAADRARGEHSGGGHASNGRGGNSSGSHTR